MAELNSTRLYEIFVASFGSDPNHRISAELELRKLNSSPQLLPSLLHLIAPSPSPSPESPQVRLAASIYLKNLLQTSTPSSLDSVKASILPLLASLDSSTSADLQIKKQLGSVLGTVVDKEWPTKWEGLVEELQGLLTGSRGEGGVEAGLRGAVEVFRGFRYQLRDAPTTPTHTLPSITHALLPPILSLINTLLSTLTSTSASLAAQGNLLHLALKCYKHAISSELVEELQGGAMVMAWGSVMLQVIGRQLDESLLGEGEEKEKSGWGSSKKWAAWSLNRLFSSYGNPVTLTSRTKTPYANFAARFVKEVAPVILRAYFGVVEHFIAGLWVPKKVVGLTLSFFEECIRPVATWALLKPHVPQLIAKFVFPLVCLTEDEIELFSDDPAEFLRGHLGEFLEESWSSPSSTALAFVAALVENRKVATLMPTLEFIQGVASRYPGESTPREKDGALRLLGSLALTATKSKKIAPMMESFFTGHVLPEFKSPHGFLRYRACEVVEKFESCDMDWQQRENLEHMFTAILGAVTDTDLPVRCQAAIALPELARYDEVRARMVPNIGRVMQELLKMSNEVDLDALTNAMRSLVSEFSEEVIPFAVELTQSLVGSYTRLVAEALDQRQKEEQGQPAEDGSDEKTFVCINILKTIDQLVRSLEDAPESLDRSEAIIVPALAGTVQNGMVELYDEVYEILDSITFFRKTISPAMWPMFEASYHAFKTDAEDYFSEMCSCLDNFVSFGASTFATSTDYRRMLIDMFDTAMTSPSLGADDRVAACKLGEAMLLYLRGNIDEAIPPLVERSMFFVLSDKSTDPNFTVTSALYLHSLELVITAIFYNPSLTLAILDRHGWTPKFFAAWFKNIPKFTRVHDRKLGIGAMCAIFEWLASVGAAPLAQSSSQLVVGALQIFREFPAALNARAEYEKSFADNDYEDDDEEILEGEDEEDIFEAGGEEGDVVDQNTAYLEMLAKASAAREADGDSDAGSSWSEEILWASPMDSLDVYLKFTETLTSLEANQPALFQLATQPLTAAQRAELEAVAGRALNGGEKSFAITLALSSS